jgi:hypothetical protein
MTPLDILIGSLPFGVGHNATPIALFGFNLGVEIGQLLFVSIVLLIPPLFQQAWNKLPKWSAKIPGYGIGSLSLFWMWERLLT